MVSPKVMVISGDGVRPSHGWMGGWMAKSACAVLCVQCSPSEAVLIAISAQGRDGPGT